MPVKRVESEEMYESELRGFSMFSDQYVTVIGEQVAELEDGRVVEQYLYHIDGVSPENGKPFVSLKANIRIME